MIRNSVTLLLAGIVLIIAGTLRFITGDGGYIHIYGIGRKIALVDWIGWILLPSGIVISIVSIRSLLRGPKNTDEEVARAKEELDRMYFEEHGFLPHQHGSPLDETNHKKDAQAKNPEQ